MVETWRGPQERMREFFVDNLLVRIHVIIVMIRWTGLAPWEFESPFPGSLTSTFLAGEGSFGVVSMGVDLATGRKCAIKRLQVEVSL